MNGCKHLWNAVDCNVLFLHYKLSWPEPWTEEFHYHRPMLWRATYSGALSLLVLPSSLLPCWGENHGLGEADLLPCPLPGRGVCLTCFIPATIFCDIWFNQSWDSSVGIAIRSGMDGPEMESPWGLDYPHLSRPVLGPTQPPVQWVLGPFPGGKATGAWRWAPTPI
jgi:hypothetical protein